MSGLEECTYASFGLEAERVAIHAGRLHKRAPIT
jgi:hypothetical protein